MAEDLTTALLSLLLLREDAKVSDPVRARLTAATPAKVEHAINALWHHNVLPMLFHQLRNQGLLTLMPETVQARLADEHLTVRRRNGQLLFAASNVLRLAGNRRQSLLCLKGLVLASDYYPDFALRPMGDIDFVCERDKEQGMFTVVQEAGFWPSERHDIAEDSLTFVSPQGLVCDAHRRLSMFAGVPWETFTRETQLARLRGVPALVLEPHAMLAHWAVHAHGHVREVGPLFIWLVDLVLIARKHAAQVDFERVRTLCRDDEAFVFMLRCFALLAWFGEPMPDDLTERLRYVPRLYAEGLLRQRRIRPWELPRPAGVLRLLAQSLGLRSFPRKPRPSLGDVLLWPVDDVLAGVALGLARVTALRGR